SKELTPMADKTNTKASDEEAIKQYQALRPALVQMMAAMDAASKDKDDDEEEEEASDKKGKDESEEKEDKDEAKDKARDEEEEEEKKDKKGEGMDAAAFAREVEKNLAIKGKLYDSLSRRIGAFDHADMSLAKMAKYGCRQLGVDAPKGQRVSFLQAFLQGMDSHVGTTTHATDAAPKRRPGNFLDRHFAKKEA